jgi:hypothetical protein
MPRVFDRLEKFPIAVDAANVLRRTGTSTLQAARVLAPWFSRDDSFQANPMFPPVTKIVGVKGDRVLKTEVAIYRYVPSLQNPSIIVVPLVIRNADPVWLLSFRIRNLELV